MSPYTMILIAMLSSGAIEWQPMQSRVCEAIVDQTTRGIPAIGVRDDGSELTIVQAICIPDTLATRLELMGPSLGVCEEGV